MRARFRSIGGAAQPKPPKSTVPALLSSLIDVPREDLSAVLGAYGTSRACLRHAMREDAAAKVAIDLIAELMASIGDAGLGE